MTQPQRPEPGKAVATREQSPLRNVAEVLGRGEARAEIEKMLRPGESFERVIVEVYHAVSANPKILKCTPQSIVSATARAVGTGLIIGDTVHLVPFDDRRSGESRLQPIIDYKGKIQLILNSGAARFIDAHCVYKNEVFKQVLGTSPTIEHHPVLDPKGRGPMVGAYAIAVLSRNRFVPLVLSAEEIELVRQKYSKQHKEGELPYWYAQKTCIHRLAKLLPKNPELARVLAMFDREEDEEAEREAAALEAEELVHSDEEAAKYERAKESAAASARPTPSPEVNTQGVGALLLCPRCGRSSCPGSRDAGASHVANDTGGAGGLSTPPVGRMGAVMNEVAQGSGSSDAGAGGALGSHSDAAALAATRPVATVRPPSGAEYLLPYGAKKGTPLGAMDTEVLAQWLSWANEQQGDGEAREFALAAEEVLEERRLHPSDPKVTP